VHKIIERPFHLLARKLKNSAFNISCDSLPAHLSSFYGVKTLVMLPKDNLYWLPLNSYLTGNHLTFEELGAYNPQKLHTLIERNYKNLNA
jgi:ADP-heptose:LPS heptosyltransferase